MATSSPDQRLLLRLVTTAQDPDAPLPVRRYAILQVGLWLDDVILVDKSKWRSPK